MRVTIAMYSPSGELTPDELTIGRELVVPLNDPEFEAIYFMADVMLSPVEDSSRLDMSISIQHARELLTMAELPQGTFTAPIVGAIEMDGSFRFMANLPHTMEFIWGLETDTLGLVLVRYPAEIILHSGIRHYESVVLRNEFIAALDALIKTSESYIL